MFYKIKVLKFSMFLILEAFYDDIEKKHLTYENV